MRKVWTRGLGERSGHPRESTDPGAALAREARWVCRVFPSPDRQQEQAEETQDDGDLADQADLEVDGVLVPPGRIEV